MDKLAGKIKTLRIILLLFMATLFWSFHIFFIYFINSTFIASITGEKMIGFVFAFGALVSILLLLFIPRILKRIGNFKLALTLCVIEFIAVLAMALSQNPLIVIAAFIVQQVAGPTIYYTLDIFLEKYSGENNISSLRGIQLTVVNLPPILSPFITGIILSGNADYWKVYLISAAFLIPLTVIFITTFAHFKDEIYEVVHIEDAMKHFYTNKNVFDVFVDSLLLHLFYAWMAIYMPLYLHNHIGFSWEEIGLMFSIMLLPFLLLQIPLGKQEDIKHDEKAVLMIGFVIMGACTMLIPFIHEANFVIWTAILFLTRIGASIVEVSCDGFFFKHVPQSNTTYLSFYRMTRSVVYVAVPFLAGLCLMFLPFSYMFLVLGLIMFLGVRYAVRLQA